MQSILNNEEVLNASENTNIEINTCKPKIKIYNHTEIFNDMYIIYYKIMLLTDSMFVWIGSELLNEKNNITHMNNLAMSMKTKFVILFSKIILLYSINNNFNINYFFH